MPVKVVAVVVCHGHGDVVRDTGLLGNLVAQGIHVLCLDNTGSDIILKEECELNEITLIGNSIPRGLSQNINLCVGKLDVQSDVRNLLLLINPDVIIENSLLVAIKRSVENIFPAICGFEIADNKQTSLLRNPLTPLQLLKAFMVRSFNLSFAKECASLGNTYNVNGCALLCDLTLFNSISGFDERFYLYCEDVDFVDRACAKIGLRGPRIIWGTRIHHLGGYASRKLFSRAFRLHVTSLVKYFLKRYRARILNWWSTSA